MKKGKTCEVWCNYKIRIEKTHLARACYKADVATFESKALQGTYFASLDLQKVLMLSEISVIKLVVYTQPIWEKTVKYVALV